jgi:hypothetical protein
MDRSTRVLTMVLLINVGDQRHGQCCRSGDAGSDQMVVASMLLFAP